MPLGTSDSSGVPVVVPGCAPRRVSGPLRKELAHVEARLYCQLFLERFEAVQQLPVIRVAGVGKYKLATGSGSSRALGQRRSQEEILLRVVEADREATGIASARY